MAEKCENCSYFDGSKHENDKRTAHAGICSKWTEIVFKSETCKQFFSNENKTEKEIFIPLVDVSKLPPSNQLTFF
jgi:spore cortex formation protein SpoVR/YcgB (stage V sporulation)